MAMQVLLWDSPGKNTWVGCHVLLQVIFPIQGSNQCLLCLTYIGRGGFTTSTTWEAHPPGDRNQKKKERKKITSVGVDLKNLEPHTLLVEMWNGAATVKINLAGFQKL